MGTIECKIMHVYLRLTWRMWKRRAQEGWPNSGHPPRHCFQRRLRCPWRKGRICWYCGLETL